MEAFAQLLIRLRSGDADGHIVELEFSSPGSDAVIRPEAGRARFDLAALRATLDADDYGDLLTRSLVADGRVSAVVEQARVTADLLKAPLRVRLAIDADAAELNDLRWEMLRDPRDPRAPPDRGSLLMSERILFSRYVSSADWRAVEARPKVELRALIVIANPIDLEEYPINGQPLPPVDVAGELQRARDSLGAIPTITLASGGTATLDNLARRLRDDRCDILYLVCHGSRIAGETRLWLEDEAGRRDLVAGDALAEQLRQLLAPPRLVVLAACQTAGGGDEPRSRDEGLLAALGPRLAREGVPAVLAMQGNVTMETVRRFMPVLFEELQRDGQIDRAVALARGAARGRHDYWAPALFMRLASGRIWWYVPGFTGGADGFRRWPDIISSIRNGTCAPILGPGLNAFLLGSRREIAQHWAEAEGYPLAYAREDLARVAQFVAVSRSDGYLHDKLRNYVIDALLTRYGADLPEEARAAPRDPQARPQYLDRLVREVGAQRRARDVLEPHRVLANLPLSLYLTTKWDNLMADALDEAGRPPQVVLCPWNDAVVFDRTLKTQWPLREEPSVDRPLVYHLFGRLGAPKSLVLTEDDYFDYLIGVTTNKAKIPEIVRTAQANRALLMLGFQLDDWNFRVLFRTIMNMRGGDLRSDYAHVAVQISPEATGAVVDPESARRYLEEDFGDADISIYWGSTEDFVNELWQHWKASEASG